MGWINPTRAGISRGTGILPVMWHGRLAHVLRRALSRRRLGKGGRNPFAPCEIASEWESPSHSVQAEILSYPHLSVTTRMNLENAVAPLIFTDEH
jgi:hypothetical protein